eukprot:TRINITY_DN6536_c0_g1_i2.p1 TRINITY_DN6536_c0_g1~~TRINITY_DN6536_c0_g1_i2.p1  ORF type:complete len:696 (+),score=276.73 TRINITY_DN6536_c0_g1_i2:63-2150(+)
MTRPPSAGASRGTVRESTVGKQDKQYFAVEQGSHNFELKTHLTDAQDQQAALYALQSEAAKDALKMLKARHAEGVQRLVEFGRGFKCVKGQADPAGAAAVIEKCGLATGRDVLAQRNAGAAVKTFEFNALLDAAILETETNLTMRNERVQGIDAEDVFAVSQESATAGGSPTRSVEDRPHATHRTARQARDGEPFRALPHYLLPDEASFVEEMVRTTVEMMGIDALEYVRDELSRSKCRLHACQMRLEEKQEAQDHAVRAREMGKADAALCEVVDVLEDMVDLAHARLQHTNNGSDDAGSFKNLYTRHKQKTVSFLAKAGAERKVLDENLASDTDALVKKREEESQAHLVATDTFWREQDDSLTKIEAVHLEQTALWEEIGRMVKEVARLGQVKSDEAVKYVERKEAEERRIRAHNEFLQAMDAHAHDLVKLRENVARSQELVKDIDAFFARGCVLIESRNVEAELTAIRERELKLSLEVYRRFTLAIGDLSMRRQTRLQGVRRLIRNQEAQLALCMDSFDPLEEHYKEELDSLRIIEKEVGAQVESLARRARRREELFEPVEQELDERDFDFTPPKFEVKELEQGKRDRLLEVSKTYLSQEQDEMAREVITIRKLHSTVATGRDLFLHRREQKKHRLKSVDFTLPSSRPQSAFAAPRPATATPIPRTASALRAERSLPPLNDTLDTPPTMANCP